MVQSLIEYPNGGKIEIYKMVNTATNDFKKIFVCCEYFAKQGKCAIITPRFGENIGDADLPNVRAGCLCPQCRFFSFFIEMFSDSS